MAAKWHGWEDLGGPITSAPAVASWGPARLDVFAAGADGQLVHKWWDGVKWHDWETIGGVFKGGPAAVSWGGGSHRIDVFVRGQDDHLGHIWWGGKKKWHTWEDLGGPITSPPAVASWGVDRLDVFAAGADGQLVHKWWDGSKWHDWETLGGVFKGAPAAVSWGLHRIDVFVQGIDAHLGHLWWDSKKWRGWEDLSVSVSPGTTTGWVRQPPAVASWNWGRLDVFFAADVPHAEGGLFPPELVHMWWDDTNELDLVELVNKRQWSSFDALGGVYYDNPAAVAKASHEIDIFVRGKDDHLGHLWRRKS